MATQHLLSPAERKVFQSPPVFTAEEKLAYFQLTHVIQKTLDTIRFPSHKVGFLLQWGYFKRTGQFYSTRRFYKHDIHFVAGLLNVEVQTLHMIHYKENTRINHQKLILSFQGFQSFDHNGSAQQLLLSEVTRLVAKHVRPKRMIGQLSDLFFQKKIAVPSYHQFKVAIVSVLNDHESKLTYTLKKHLSVKQQVLLDELIPKVSKNKNANNDQNSNAIYARASLIQLRIIPQSSRPAKIKESIKGFLSIKSLFEAVQPVLHALDLSPESQRHYAIWVQKAKITQLTQFINPHKRYLYLLAFISHQYHFRQDLLVDTLLKAVQSALNKANQKQQDETFKKRKEKDRATQKLSSFYHRNLSLLDKIRNIVHVVELSDQEKVEHIQILLGSRDAIESKEEDACIALLDKQIASTFMDADYYTALEDHSIPLQNKVSLILKHLEFNRSTSQISLLDAIEYFQEKEGNIGQNPPCKFLDESETQRLRDEEGRWRISLYKVLLFIKVAEAIKSGELNLMYSYRYLSIDEYLIRKHDWKNHFWDYIQCSSLEPLVEFKKVVDPLQHALHMQYQKTNDNVLKGKNRYVTFNKQEELIVETPKVEKIGTQRISELLLKNQYISVLDVLSNIDQITQFSQSLQHYTIKEKKKRPIAALFYAGIIGKGCNIGINKLGSPAYPAQTGNGALRPLKG